MGTQKVKFSGKLYLGTRAEEQEAKIRRALRKGAWFPGLFLITYPLNEAEQLDIIEAKYLRNDIILRTLPPVVGLAVGKREAYEVLAQIAGETFQATGSCDMKSYLRQTDAPGMCTRSRSIS